MRAIALLLLGLLAGCVNADTRWSDGNGHTGRCSATAFGLISSIVSAVEVEKCKDFYRDQGWKMVGE